MRHIKGYHNVKRHVVYYLLDYSNVYYEEVKVYPTVPRIFIPPLSGLSVEGKQGRVTLIVVV